MKIRPIKSSDAPALEEVLAMVNFETLTEKWLGDWPRDGDGGVVAYDGELVGGCWFRLFDLPGPPQELIVAVNPEYQRLGVGQQLIAGAMEQARDLGTSLLRAAVFPENEDAHRLLSKFDAHRRTSEPSIEGRRGKVEYLLSLDDKIHFSPDR